MQLFFPGNDTKIKPGEVGFRPSTAFEARINKISLDIGSIRFERFYPLDMGPLAATPGPFDEGLVIHVPSDLKELQKIRARFVLLPKNKENSVSTDKSVVPEVFKKAFEGRKDF